MSDILVRGLEDGYKRSLGMLAASLDVSMNTLIIWVLEEAAMPYDELRSALQQRAEEVHRRSVPQPHVPTQPFRNEPKPKHRRYGYQEPIIVKGGYDND